MNNAPQQCVLIMAGGTGGHVFPALAAADCLRKRGVDVQWLGTRRGIESTVVPAANIPIHYINVAGIRGKGFVSVLKAIVQMLTALIQAFRVVRRLKPICVLGMGGFASGPGGVAAWLTGKPLVIHEQNAVAGTTNRILATFATRVLQGYPMTLGGKKAHYIGNPVRKAIAELPAPEQRWQPEPHALKLLVLGGSLGSKPINDVLIDALQQMPAAQRPQVWHQSGSAHFNSVSDAYDAAGLDVRVQAFIDDMSAAYAWADLVLCRAGALTVAEISCAGVASVLVPLPHAIDDHQTHNAKWLVDHHAAVMLKQSDMTARSLAQLLVTLTQKTADLLAMANAARSLAKTDAAEQVAVHCLEVANV